jgi:transcriptional regulator with PAS, ATPase and Fis domain
LGKVWHNEGSSVSEELIVEHELKTITIKATSGSLTLREAVRAYERIIILEVLKIHNDDKESVAKLLQISMSSLYRKLGEEPPSYERGNLGSEMEYE